MKECLLQMVKSMFRSRLRVGIIVLFLTLGTIFIFTLTKSDQYIINKSTHSSTISKMIYYTQFNVDYIDDVIDRATKETTHIMFLKVHKAASSTVQNIFYRFGIKRNLSFVLPLNTHYISKEMHFFSDFLAPLPPEVCVNRNGGKCHPNLANKYDILCNHMVFNRLKCRKLLHQDSVYIGIVREPFDQFISSAFYYKFKYHYPYLDRLSNDTFILDLIREPQKYESTTMIESMTFNSMSYDFGFSFASVKNAEKLKDEAFENFLNKTQDNFDLVMVMEKFDESLILMRRKLNWSLRDILYLKNNEFKPKFNKSVTMTTPHISAKDMALFKKRNRFDYKLYDFFRQRLNEQLSREQNLHEEVKYFRMVLKDLQTFCFSNLMKIRSINVTEYDNYDDYDYDETGTQIPSYEEELIAMLRTKELTIPENEWNSEFNVNVKECEYMDMEELSFFKIMKSRHLDMLKERIVVNDFSKRNI
ncbi:Galactose-3-O-sulfotransferase 3 [Mactra antiquata]